MKVQKIGSEDKIGGLEATVEGNLEDSHLRREEVLVRVSPENGENLGNGFEIQDRQDEIEDICVRDVTAIGNEVRVGRLEAGGGKKERREAGGENLKKLGEVGRAASLELGTVTSLEEEEEFTQL